MHIERELDLFNIKQSNSKVHFNYLSYFTQEKNYDYTDVIQLNAFIKVIKKS